MKQKSILSKKNILISSIFLGIIIYFLSSLKVNYIEFEGDLTYLDPSISRISSLVFLKNKNLIIFKKDEFIKDLTEINPEIERVEISPKNSGLIQVKIVNKDICCVVNDINTNKFLISREGKVIKKLLRDQNYPHEITLKQEINMNSSLSIDSLKKIVEIENVLLGRDLEVSELKLENDKIEFKLKSDQFLVIDSSTNTKNFVEKLNSMLDYFKQKNITFKKMDFRFGNVVVE